MTIIFLFLRQTKITLFIYTSNRVMKYKSIVVESSLCSSRMNVTQKIHFFVYIYSYHLAQNGHIIWHKPALSLGTKRPHQSAQNGLIIWHKTATSVGTKRPYQLAQNVHHLILYRHHETRTK